MLLNLVLVGDLSALVQPRLAALHYALDSLALLLICLRFNPLLVSLDLVERGKREVTQLGRLPHAFLFHARDCAAAILDLN